MKHLLFAASLIETAGLGNQGTDLFIGALPADVTAGVMLRDPLYGAEIDEGMKDVYEHSFQVIVRDPDPAAGYARALAISKALRYDHQDSADIYIVCMRAETLPVTYPMGDADLVETSVRIYVTFGDKP